MCVVNNTMQICPILPISISFNHKAVGGAEAAQFLQAILADLEQKYSMIETKFQAITS